ncbi:hypothetical protein [Sphingomonas sp. TREG-RG-20F-R18-01]|uniref:hypothetical protein n=1 Tax=Sphingomonas sp. TREG-RG-20F-R18-01 TaxID=2914982 RepID=UPI001F58663F|nr:hypothetical protein [Sphingomonas sp. TREG-RG-20F-R18-01]
MDNATTARRPRASDWCILRTSPGRTLQLAASLVAAGLDVWSPAQTYDRRKPRSKATVEITAAIMPTFVFARAGLLPELMRIHALPVSPHPPFSIFRHLGGTVLLFDREIANLREAEELRQRARLKVKDLRQRAELRRSHRHVFPTGQKVNLQEGSFVGLEGVVQGGDGKFALVCFGGAQAFKIATFLLRTEDIETNS